MNPAPAFCHRCGRMTPTVLIRFRPDLVGICCATCRACRKGKPYASKRDLAQSNIKPLTPPPATGEICDHAPTL
ncbi:MAG: hypothetical protein NTV49_02155 [Kiritimatiellaeota bacterium]|nr:hypothetical protein [Kiritimatiellota bacterium]